VAHTWAEAGESQVQGQPELLGETVSKPKQQDLLGFPHMPGSVQGFGMISVNKTDKVPCLGELRHIFTGERQRMRKNNASPPAVNQKLGTLFSLCFHPILHLRLGIGLMCSLA
jgi:hypothetical protein